jgi:hypothetical protein
LAVAVFEFYFAVYPTRHLTLPVGFDTSWYVWRAQFVAVEGVGRLGTSLRPGHALLSSVLGSVTGLNQLELAVVLPLLLVSVFALALGAFVRTCFGVDRMGWAITVAVAGPLLGTTRLVGENVANLLNLALLAASLAFIGRRVDGRRGFVGAVGLLVAAGLAHWLFLAVAGAALALSAGLALPESLRRREGGIPFLDTEAGTVGAVTATAGAMMAATIAGILRAPFQTFEIREDPARFLPKLRTDLGQLLLPGLGPVAVAGAAGLVTGKSETTGWGKLHGSARSFGLHLLLAWTVVGAVGIAYGAITLNLPPHRFLTFVVAVPGAVVLTAALLWGINWMRSWSGPRLAAAFVGAGVLAMALPGAAAWYWHGPDVWIDRAGLQQATTASRYVERQPPGRPVVFLVNEVGPAGVLSVPLKERLIRMALPPEREPDLHLFVGDPADLLASRRTTPSDLGTNDATLPYWEDVRTVLPEHPPVIILQSLADEQYTHAVDTMGARVIGPGVALLQGPVVPGGPLAAEPLPRPVPGQFVGLLWAGLILALLFAAGAAWTFALAGAGTPPEITWSLAPAVGAAAIMLGALVPGRLGLHLGGAAGIVIYAVVTVAGFVAAGLNMRSVAGVTPTQSSQTGS